jgi:hypothetical protein
LGGREERSNGMTHNHKHDQTASDDLAKLRILLPHWIEHNDEHAASFRGWTERAREIGLEAVAKQMEVAVERMAACGEALAAALKELEK